MRHAFTESVLLVTLVSATLLLIGEPFWQTNDDPAMAAAIHGFGDFVAEGPPWLINSNIIWGYLLRMIPEIGGVLGYTTGNYLVILSAVIAIHWSMVNLSVDPIGRVLLTALFLTWLILFPQFTVTAGLSTLAAIALFQVFLLRAERVETSSWLLVIAAGFALVGFLIRDLQFALMLLVASPWLLTSKLSQRRILGAGAITAVLLLSVWLINQQSYDDPQWQPYLVLNEARTAYTDFDGAIRVLESGAASDAGYSTNDIMLLRNWFFSDPALADPTKMNSMLENSPDQSSAWKAADVLTPFFSFKHLWAMLLVTVVLSAISRSRYVALAWLMFLVVAFSISYLGRVVPERLILTIYLLFCFQSLLVIQSLRAKRFAAVLMLLGFFGNAALIGQAQNAWQQQIELQEQVAGYLRQPNTVVWSDAFRPEIVHRPFQRDNQFRDYHYQAIGQSALSPNAVAYQAAQRDTGILDLLQSEHGMQLIAFGYQIKMLGTYCAERLDRLIEGSTAWQDMTDDALVVTNVRCFRTSFNTTSDE